MPAGSPEHTPATQQVGEAVEMATGAVMSAAGAIPPPAAALNTNLTNELNGIDFRKMIGGPLQAAVDAQIASSLATINFIKAVGFTAPTDNSTPELVMVDFSHKRTKGEGEAQTTETVDLRVPLLAMLPIPSLRLEVVTVDFNVKLNSVETSQVSDEFKIGAEVKAGWGPVNLKVTTSYQRKTSTNVEVKKEYSLNVNIKAVQDEIPAGLEKILGIIAA
ncbi:MAG: DUF2589 domain-containing protein [Acidimicrobiia bacterium]